MSSRQQKYGTIVAKTRIIIVYWSKTHLSQHCCKLPHEEKQLTVYLMAVVGFRLVLDNVKDVITMTVGINHPTKGE